MIFWQRQDHYFCKETARKSGHTLEGQGVAEKISKHVDLLFQQGSCVVSAAALGLMELVHLALKLEKQFDSIDQVAILVHNDCYYLSQEILGLAFEYRLDFPSGMKENASFADVAPTFCQMAEETLEKQLQLVISSLNEAIDGAEGFQNTHIMQQYESAKFSIDQVVFILEKVCILWNSLLLRSTYKRIMCLVLESVFSRITKDVLQLGDMAAEETLQVQSFVKAIFTDSPLRRDCLWRIESSSF